MELSIHYLYPFDLGLELDPNLTQRRYAREILRLSNAGDVFFEGKHLGPAQMLSYLYPFGVGMIELIVPIKGELSTASELVVNADKVLIGRYPVENFCATQAPRIRSRAASLARPDSKTAPRADAAEELFALVLSSRNNERVDAGTFLRRNEKTLLGIATGEPSYSRLSAYALEKESLRNIAYYEDEVILIRRYGAFLHSKEQDTVKDLISLALAQYFNVKAANALLERSMLRARAVLEEQPPFHHFWKIPGAYHRLSAEQNEFAKAKIALVDSLHTAHIQIPAIDSDWHLKSVHQEIMAVFDLEEQAKVAMTRLETVDSIYGHLGEHLSTVFFIFLDFVFFTWLAVDLVGWVLLLVKMK